METLLLNLSWFQSSTLFTLNLKLSSFNYLSLNENIVMNQRSAQRLRVHILAEDPGLVASTHSWLTTAYNYSSGNLMPPSDLCGIRHTCNAHIHIQALTHTHKIKINVIIFTCII